MTTYGIPLQESVRMMQRCAGARSRCDERWKVTHDDALRDATDALDMAEALIRRFAFPVMCAACGDRVTATTGTT